MAPASRRVCAQCRRLPASPAWRPFCSERCKLLDLARWIDADYRVAGEAVTRDFDPDLDPDHPAASDS